MKQITNYKNLNNSNRDITPITPLAISFLHSYINMGCPKNICVVTRTSNILSETVIQIV